MARKVKKEWNIKTASKGEIVTLRVLLIILGVMLLLMGLVFFVLIPLAVLAFYFAHVCKNELKRRKGDMTAQPVPPQPAQTESPYIFLRFKVAGVTFKNGRKTRQAILRAFKWGDETPETVDFERYLYEGNDAVHVKINNQVVGDIPSKLVQTFIEYEGKYKRDNIHCDIYGGSKLDDGSRTNYGCEIVVRYLM